MAKSYTIKVDNKTVGTYTDLDEALTTAKALGGEVIENTASVKTSPRPTPAAKKPEPTFGDKVAETAKSLGIGMARAARFPYAVGANVPGAIGALVSKATAPESDTTSYFAPVRAKYNEILDRSYGDQSFGEQLLTDPTMLLPTPLKTSLGTAVVKGGSKFAPYIAKSAQGALEGAAQGLESSIWRDLEGNGNYAENTLGGAGLGAVLPPALAKAGNVVQGEGREILERAIRTPEAVLNFAANKPDVGKLLAVPSEPSSKIQWLKNVLQVGERGGTKNIVPYHGGTPALALALDDELNRIGKIDPDVLNTLGGSHAYSVDMNTPLQGYMGDVQQQFLAGKTGEEGLSKAAQLVAKEKKDLLAQRVARISMDPGAAEALTKLGYDAKDIRFLQQPNIASQADLERWNMLNDKVAKDLNLGIDALPFDLAYGARQRYNTASNWDRTFDPKRDVFAEQAYRDLASGTTKELSDVAKNTNRINTFLESLPLEQQQVVAPFLPEYYSLVKELSNKMPKAQAEKAAANWLKMQSRYADLMPLRDPILRAATKDIRNLPVGLGPMVLAAGGIGSGSAPGVIGGLTAAAALGGSRSSGAGSMLYDFGGQLANDRQMVLRAALRLINERNED